MWMHIYWHHFHRWQHYRKAQIHSGGMQLTECHSSNVYVYFRCRRLTNGQCLKTHLGVFKQWTQWGGRSVDIGSLQQVTVIVWTRLQIMLLPLNKLHSPLQYISFYSNCQVNQSIQPLQRNAMTNHASKTFPFLPSLIYSVLSTLFLVE